MLKWPFIVILLAGQTFGSVSRLTERSLLFLSSAFETLRGRLQRREYTQKKYPEKESRKEP